MTAWRLKHSAKCMSERLLSGDDDCPACGDSLLAIARRGRALGLPTIFTTDGIRNHVFVAPGAGDNRSVHWAQVCAPNYMVAEPYYWLERYGLAPRCCVVCRSAVGAVLASSRRRPRSGI